MSFQEKSTWLMLAIMTVVYGVYFVGIFNEAADGDAATIDYQGQMVATVSVLVTLIVVSYIIVAAVNPRDADQSDERDQAINRFGGYVGGYVLDFGALLALGLALAEVEYFWIANAILLALVVSEIVSGGTKIVLYRRGV